MSTEKEMHDAANEVWGAGYAKGHEAASQYDVLAENYLEGVRAGIADGLKAMEEASREQGVL